MIYHKLQTKLGHNAMLTILVFFIKKKDAEKIQKFLNKESSWLCDFQLNQE